MANVYLAFSVIILNTNGLNTWNGKLLFLSRLFHFRWKFKQDYKKTKHKTTTIQRDIILKTH